MRLALIGVLGALLASCGAGDVPATAVQDSSNGDHDHLQATAQEQAADEGDTPLLTMQVLTPSELDPVDEEWGVFVEYFSGESAGAKDILSGTATLNPGFEAHPPHRHAEEEFLMVVEGEGTWTLGDKDFPAKTGDMLYSAAWDLHGIKNTGDKPLTFVFWKWNSKGLPVPSDPEQ